MIVTGFPPDCRSRESGSLSESGIKKEIPAFAGMTDQTIRAIVASVLNNEKIAPVGVEQECIMFI